MQWQWLGSQSGVGNARRHLRPLRQAPRRMIEKFWRVSLYRKARVLSG